MGKLKESCSLCGGKLKNGICTECGMDNRKNDSMYKSMLNQGEHYSLNTAQSQTAERSQKTQPQTAEQSRRTQPQPTEQWQQAEQSYRTQYQKAKTAEKAAKDSSQKKYPNASGNRNIFYVRAALYTAAVHRCAEGNRQKKRRTDGVFYRYLCIGCDFESGGNF